MILKDLMNQLNKLIEENPELLNHEVHSQDIDSNIYGVTSINVGNGTSDGFVVEEFYTDPKSWLAEMGYEYSNMKDFIKSEDNTDMKSMIYFKV